MRLGLVRHDHLLAARPDVEPRVVAERAADVEEVVVGVDEEVAAARALDVVEGRDRRADQGARADGAAGPAHHEPEPVLLAEALEQVLERDPARPARSISNIELRSSRAECICGVIYQGSGRFQPRGDAPWKTTAGGAALCRGSARAVVIGAGIVGNCLVGHLARLGWSDIVLLDKGPLPNPGGSTGHASNFIFPVDHSKEMAALTLDSQRQYEELGVLTHVRRHRGGAHRGADGGAPPADDVGRRRGASRARLVTPAEIKELVPFIDESVILGGFYTPTASASSTRCGRAR